MYMRRHEQMKHQCLQSEATVNKLFRNIKSTNYGNNPDQDLYAPKEYSKSQCVNTNQICC